MIVYFQNCKGESRKIGAAADRGKAWAIIYKFIEEHNYRPDYVRTWDADGRHYYDVGSHTEFFYTEEE